MKIVLNRAGKRFNSEWIFRNLDHEFVPGSACAILGANGSGKSTLLQVIAGSMQASEGRVEYHNGTRVKDEDVFRLISFASPYLELPEELTLEEAISFHFKFKKPLRNFSADEVIGLSALESSRRKQLKYFSSGMKQRTRLLLAVLSDTPVLLLDEPATNLDPAGVHWYRKLVEEYAEQRLVIVCSNHQREEYEFCSSSIDISAYKS